MAPEIDEQSESPRDRSRRHVERAEALLEELRAELDAGRKLRAELDPAPLPAASALSEASPSLAPRALEVVKTERDARILETEYPCPLDQELLDELVAVLRSGGTTGLDWVTIDRAVNPKFEPRRLYHLGTALSWLLYWGDATALVCFEHFGADDAPVTTLPQIRYRLADLSADGAPN